MNDHGVVGEQPTEEQKKRLYRMRDALGLANNDALWLVLLALEHYDGRFRKYPDQLGLEAMRLFEGQRVAFAQGAAAETARSQRSLARAVAATAQELAGRTADAARWRAWATVAAGMVLFGALCTTAGFTMGAGQPPPWAELREVPVPSRIGRRHRGRAGWLEPLTGLALLAGAIAGLVTCATVLGRVLAGR
jgi:hypothetical protein